MKWSKKSGKLSYLVKPAIDPLNASNHKAQPKKSIKLSVIDENIAKFLFVTHILTFPERIDAEIIRRSLELTLCHFPILAGRMMIYNVSIIKHMIFYNLCTYI